MQVSDYPHLKDEARKRILKSLEKQLNSYIETDTKSATKVLSNEELMRLISGR